MPGKILSFSDRHSARPTCIYSKYMYILSKICRLSIKVFVILTQNKIIYFFDNIFANIQTWRLILQKIIQNSAIFFILIYFVYLSFNKVHGCFISSNHCFRRACQIWFQISGLFQVVWHET